MFEKISNMLISHKCLCVAQVRGYQQLTYWLWEYSSALHCIDPIYQEPYKLVVPFVLHPVGLVAQSIGPAFIGPKQCKWCANQEVSEPNWFGDAIIRQPIGLTHQWIFWDVNWSYDTCSTSHLVCRLEPGWWTAHWFYSLQGCVSKTLMSF